MKKMVTPKFLFHLTVSKKWGDKKKIEPRLKGRNRAFGEPEISRICVSPDITGCLLAIPYTDRQTYYIYRTYKKVRAYYPYEVEDSHITKEKWITVPTTFVKIGKISSGLIKKLPAESCCEVEKQKKSLSKIKKILKDNLHVPIEYI
jgi:hypothetical protein